MPIRNILIVSVLIVLSGCITERKVDISNLKLLSNDEICRALGENNNNASLVLKMHEEIDRRGDTVDNEYCYALEKNYQNNGTVISIEPTATPPGIEHVYDHKKGKYVIKNSGVHAGLDINLSPFQPFNR